MGQATRSLAIVGSLQGRGEVGGLLSRRGDRGLTSGDVDGGGTGRHDEGLQIRRGGDVRVIKNLVKAGWKGSRIKVGGIVVIVVVVVVTVMVVVGAGVRIEGMSRPGKIGR